MKELNADQKSRARKLRQDGFSWKKIAKHLKTSVFTLRYSVDEEYRELYLARLKDQENIKVEGFDYTEMLPVEDGIERNPEYDPKRDGVPVWVSPASQLLGEPPVGRRAIDRI